MEISAREFTDWQHDAVTTLVMRWLKSSREDLKEQMATGECIRATTEDTALEYTAWQARCEAYEDILSLTYVGLMDDLEFINEGEENVGGEDTTGSAGY